MMKFKLYNNPESKVPGIELNTTAGKQIVGESRVEYRTYYTLSNMVGTFAIKDSTLNFGERTTDEIITEVLDNYSVVWEALA